MATVRPFKAVRPKCDLAAVVAALPYDVMNTEEARQMATGNPYSFLRVDKAEIDLPPETDQYDPAVYARAKENLQKLMREAMQQDDVPNLYIYRLTGYGQCQTGLAACVSADEYERGLIKRHEFTRPDKEADRVRHVEATEAHTGPIFLAYRDPQSANSPKEIMAKYVKNAPEYDFTAEDGVRHELWVVHDTATINALVAAFEKIPALYIADGHHRNATAAIVAKKRNELTRTSTGANADPNAEHNFYLAVIFPHDELAILDYNRVVQDLNGLSLDEFLQKLTLEWNVEKSAAPVKPSQKFEVGMYTKGQWHRMTKKNPPSSADPIENLDCSVLQNTLLAPILGITDPRADKRIDFVGGIRGLEGLEARVNSGEMTVAFALHPTSMDELMSVADANQIMPPKSTWFEPKLRSGLLVHLF
ncbi:MAG: DUF1015 family protein [Defluviitaleaceae bacterium]|nr:DUF1015 family protein [Defluviitaleaceae bacterium]